MNISTVVTEEKVSAVRRLFADDPGRPIRNASSASELSYKLVRDILHEDINFKPWKPEDMDRRLEFAETMFELAERRHAMSFKVV